MTRMMKRHGFTLVELLVAAGILGIIAALALPAIESAREAARRATCMNNLRQIGLGVHGYTGVNGCLPPNWIGFGRGGWNFYSIQTRILPFLGERSLYNAINFSVGSYPETWNFSRGWPGSVESNSINETVRLTKVAIFLCPSDGGEFKDTGTNYRGNVGVGYNYTMLAECPDSGNGLFVEIGQTTLASAPDGLSHTAMFSERLRGSGNTGVRPERDTFGLEVLVITADDLLLASRAAARLDNPLIYTEQGRYWFWMGRERTLYNHAQSPNGIIPDGAYANILTMRGMATARSHHPGGVNLMMGDGSIRFVPESIAQPVWRGLGTRNGRELVD